MSQRYTQQLEDTLYSGLVTPLPGCPDIAVSHAVSRVDGVSGFGKEANRVRLRQLKLEGYAAVLCTVDDSNEKQLAILQSNGWQRLTTFYNKRTQHSVVVFFFDLAPLEV